MSLIAIGKGMLSAPSTAKKLQSIYSRFTEGDPEALRRPLEDAYREWVRDLEHEINYQAVLLARQADAQRRLEERLDAARDDPQTARVFSNLVWEAAREATDERRQMLASATVALSLLDLPIEAKARFERVIRGLDPFDVFALYGVSRVAGHYFGDRYLRSPAHV